MQKTKSFIQFSDNSFSIGVIIGVKGNVYKKSNIQFYGNYKKEHRKKYYKLNKKYINTCSKKYYKLNKEYKKEYSKIYYIKNRKEIIIKAIKRNKANPERTALVKRKRRNWDKPEPINDYFKGSHLHHTHRNDNHQEAIFIPCDMHIKNHHSYNDKKSMNKINKLAFEWLGQQ